MVVGAQATEVDLVVIGSGPGGYVAAIRAAELGKKVTIIEKDNVGGVCLNIGCIPSKALINIGHHYQESLEEEKGENPFGLSVGNVKLNWESAQKWKQDKVVNQLTGGVKMLLKKHKVDVIQGTAEFIDNNTINVEQEDGFQLLQFNDVIISTGSRPIEIPSFPFGGRIIDSTGALSLSEVPKHLIIVGGGVIGSELGGAYRMLGSKITIVEGLDHILNGFDKEMSDIIANRVKSAGSEIFTSAMAKSATQTDKDVTLTFEVDGKEQTVTGDYLLVSVGRRPNTDLIGLNNTDVKLTDRGLIEVDDSYATNVPHIYAIGDVNGKLQLAHAATAQGLHAVHHIAARSTSDTDSCSVSRSVDPLLDLVPSCIYATPEIASVGLTLDQAKEQGLAAKSHKILSSANGKSVLSLQERGFMKVIYLEETHVIIGAQLLCARATDMISEFAVAIAQKLTLEEMASVIRPHPSFSEMITQVTTL